MFNYAKPRYQIDQLHSIPFRRLIELRKDMFTGKSLYSVPILSVKLIWNQMELLPKIIVIKSS